MTRLALLTAAVAVVAAVAAFFVGRALHAAPEGAARAFDVSGPTYDTAPLRPAESRGGFTGIGEAGALEGGLLYAGAVTAVSDESLTIAAAAGETELGLTGDDKLLRIDVLAGALSVGDRVVVRTDVASGAVVAVLVIVE